MFEESANKVCDCGECFYCFIHQKHFHTTNLNKLRLPQLFIDVAEYVGPETATPINDNSKGKLNNIPIKIKKCKLQD